MVASAKSSRCAPAIERPIRERRRARRDNRNLFDASGATAVQQGRARRVTVPRADYNPHTGVYWTEHDYQPKFSPNGVALVYVRSFQSHALLTSLNPDPCIQSLHIVNLNTGADKTIRRFPQGTYITTVDWSPDGTHLVFGLAQQANSPVGPLLQGRAETNQIYVIMLMELVSRNCAATATAGRRGGTSANAM